MLICEHLSEESAFLRLSRTSMMFIVMSLTTIGAAWILLFESGMLASCREYKSPR